MKTLEGSISISRIHNNAESDYIKIEIRDENSRCTAIEVKVSLEVFAKAVTGLSYQDCSFEFNNSGNIGKYIERCEIVVSLPYNGYTSLTEEELIEAFKPYETEGWIGSTYDGKNSKRIVEYGKPGGFNKHRIGFHRWVERKVEEQ